MVTEMMTVVVDSSKPWPVSRTRIKICGLTRVEDVHSAVRSGADAIGLVFYPHSKRALTIEQAMVLRHQVPAFVTVAALFVNASTADVRQVIRLVQPDILQFHGDESAQECRQYERPYMRAIRVGGPDTSTPEQVLATASQYDDAAGWLFDTHSLAYGGTGQGFQHSLLEQVQKTDQARPLILAGGLNPKTVGDAVSQVQPYAVDVSSGVEEAPGIKSARLVEQFVGAVRHADHLVS